MTDKHHTHLQRIGYRTPDGDAEPDQPVLLEYVAGGRVAIVAGTVGERMVRID